MREKVKRHQAQVEQNPHDGQMKNEAVRSLIEYEKAKKEELVEDQFVNHFQKFLGNSNTCRPLTDIGDIFSNNLSNVDADAMVIPVTDIEIKEAIFDIDDYKASGPDGGRLLREVNATLIALIPKLETSNKVSDFRPTACCNVLYKCNSKVLTNRIKTGLNKLVDGNQRDAWKVPKGPKFNPHLLHFGGLAFQKKKKKKAYDTVDWKFMVALLKGLGFHEKMINWIWPASLHHHFLSV
ncbi:uncharacterized protein [Rutidosis leptorrhynchoides]|uniref:uncharacterized protein n=1 Tax=Rutidosis leptorrhynchoides TaxID=125765 RepID=UPI003A997588